MKAALEEGTGIVSKRIKAIKLADKNEFGWQTVSEYLSDELASDSDDEKRMYRAERSLNVDSVRHLMSCSGRGTLIIREWPSAHFWPFLCEGSSQLSSFVSEVFVLPAVGDLVLGGPGQKREWCLARPRFPVLCFPYGVF